MTMTKAVRIAPIPPVTSSALPAGSGAPLPGFGVTHPRAPAAATTATPKRLARTDWRVMGAEELQTAGHLGFSHFRWISAAWRGRIHPGRGLSAPDAGRRWQTDLRSG